MTEQFQYSNRFKRTSPWIVFFGSTIAYGGLFYGLCRIFWTHPEDSLSGLFWASVIMGLLGGFILWNLHSSQRMWERTVTMYITCPRCHGSGRVSRDE